MGSKDRKTRKLALLVLLTLLRDKTVFSQYLDCMCLAAIPGLVFVNTKVLRSKGLDLFYAFWVQNKSVIKRVNYSIAIFDANFNSIIEIHMDDLLKAYKSGDVGGLIDPIRVPVLVNFQLEGGSKKMKSVSKENRIQKTEKSDKSENKQNCMSNTDGLLKNAMPLSIKFSTTTNSLYNQLSKLIREFTQYLKYHLRFQRSDKQTKNYTKKFPDQES